MLLKQGVPFNPSISTDVRILTVDNDHDTGILYTALFESYGATVVTTESIKEASKLLDQLCLIFQYVKPDFWVKAWLRRSGN